MECHVCRVCVLTRCGAESQHGPSGGGRLRGCDQCSADAGLGGGGFYDRSDGSGAVGVEEVAMMVFRVSVDFKPDR